MPASQLSSGDFFGSPRLSPSHNLTLLGAWCYRVSGALCGEGEAKREQLPAQPTGPNPEASRMSVEGATRGKGRRETGTSFPLPIPHFNRLGLSWIIHSICSLGSDLQMFAASICNLSRSTTPHPPQAPKGSSIRAGIQP